MNDYERRAASESGLPIQFTGRWTEFLPIVLTNFLLTIVTLGIYRFWAKARERRYLWSRTEVAGDPLEWTGTGKEMFIGFLLVMLIFLLPFYLLSQWVLPSLLARGQDLLAGLLGLILYVGLLYLVGVALFRALRYRLSRSWWRGIRGGSNEPGWNYGAEWLGRSILNLLTLGLMYPYNLVKLWNRRWSAMSFGSLDFRSEATSGELYGRWLALYALPIIMLIALIPMGLGAIMFAGDPDSLEEGAGGFLAIFGLLFLAFYILIPLAMMAFYAKFFREAAAAMRLGDVEVSFTARTWDWIKLFLGNIGLAIITLGFGILFWGYRNYSFIARHIHLHGSIDVSEMQQSSTHVPGDAEGLADAFDIGAF